MTNKRIILNDIQTSDLLYYDPGLENACFKFCQMRNIDCLPSLCNPLEYYRRTEDSFCIAEVVPEMRVNCNKNIFDASLLDRFRYQHLLFVYADDELSGVVHFSDYNKPLVDTYLFSMLSAYERSLRTLLKANGLTNRHMLDYFQSVIDSPATSNDRNKYKKRCRDYEKYQSENEKLPEFEKFYVDDLIGLAKNKLGVEISEEVKDLRDDIMHAHELVYRRNPHLADYIYDFASFERFFLLVLRLLQDYKKVNNRILFSVSASC